MHAWNHDCWAMNGRCDGVWDRRLPLRSCAAHSLYASIQMSTRLVNLFLALEAIQESAVRLWIRRQLLVVKEGQRVDLVSPYILSAAFSSHLNP